MDTGIKECCAEAANRTEPEAVEGHPEGDLLVERCKVCGCRHFELSVDTGKLGLYGQGL